LTGLPISHNRGPVVFPFEGRRSLWLRRFLTVFRFELLWM
jgi:hypothetical protein